MAADNEADRFQTASPRDRQEGVPISDPMNEPRKGDVESLERENRNLKKVISLLRATLESATDGILATDDQGSVVDLNENFSIMWDVPSASIRSCPHRSFFDTVCDQLVDSEECLRRLDEILATSPDESHDILTLRDGRIFERFSKRQLVDNTDVGRVWSFRDITRRKLAEDDLQRQSEWLQVTLKSIGDAVIACDTEGRITFMNPVAESLTGWRQELAYGQHLKTIFQIVNEESRQTVENPVERSLRLGSVVGLANHTVLIARDGSERPIDDSAAPIRDSQGNIVGVVLVFRDVTEQRREVQVRQHLAAIVESSDDAILSKNLDGKITAWNSAAERLYGYSADEILGRSFSVLLPDSQSDDAMELHRRLRLGERLDHFETQRKRKDGSLINVSVSYSPLTDADDRLTGVSVIARDISDRIRTEGHTKFLADASAALVNFVDFESMLQTVAHLAVPTFSDWCTVDLLEPNRSLRRLAVAHINDEQRERAQLLYDRVKHDSEAIYVLRSVADTGVPKFIPAMPKEWRGTVATDPEAATLYRSLNLQSLLCVPVATRDRIFGVMTFLTSESGRTFDARDLTIAAELASRAAVAIDNSQLYLALRENDRRKDEFLAMLAHELRNPLSPVRAGLELLALDGVDHESIGVMREQVDHLVRLVDDLLDVSRIMRGKIQLRKESTNLVSVVQRAIDTVRPLVGNHGHTLTVSTPSEPVWIDGDAVRIAQVVANLLNNAVKYTPPGGKIRIQVSQEGDDATITVRDNGLGIDTDLMPRLFDLFVQGDRSLERSEGGLGIGLTLVRTLVELHGGQVNAHSDGPGKGSEFRIRLPISLGANPEPAVEESDETVGARRILIVDDNVGTTKIQSQLLIKLGAHELCCAHDGPAAIKAAQEFRPDIILLDIGLPQMSGYDVARTLRSMPEFDQTLLVALTGYGAEDDRRRSRQAGFDEHLVKPPSLEQLRRLLSHPRLSKTDRSR